jgi:hypothetical protein
MKLQNYIDKNAYANDELLFLHRRLFSLMEAEDDSLIDVFEENLRPVGWTKKQFVNTLLSYIEKYDIRVDEFNFSGSQNDVEFQKWFQWIKSNIDTNSGSWVGQPCNPKQKEAVVNLSSGALSVLQNDYGLVDLSHVGDIDNFDNLEIDENLVEYLYKNITLELSRDPAVADELNEALAKYIAKFEQKELAYTPHSKYLNIATPEIHIKVIREKLAEKFSNYGNNVAIRDLEESFVENNALFVHSLLLAVGHDLIEKFYIEANHNTGVLIAKNIKINELRVKARNKYDRARPKEVLLEMSFSEEVIKIGDYGVLKPEVGSPAYTIADIIEKNKENKEVCINREKLDGVEKADLEDSNFSQVLTNIGFKGVIRDAFVIESGKDMIRLRPQLTKETLDNLDPQFEDLIEKLDSESR